MGALDDVRARRDAEEDPFNQDAARRELRRNMKGKGAGAKRKADEGDAKREQADSDKRQRVLDDQRRGGRILTGSPQLSSSVATEGAGFFFGLIAYTLALNYIRGGAPAVRGWLAAKFLNRPYTGTVEKLTPATPAGPSIADAGRITSGR